MSLDLGAGAGVRGKLLWSGAAIILAVSSIVACGGGSSNGDATATRGRPSQPTVIMSPIPETPNPTRAAANETAPATNPTPTQVFIYCNSDVTEAHTTPEPEQPLPKGTACVDDPGSDVAADGGQPAAEPVTGADLAAVRIDSNGSRLVVTWYSNTDIPTKIDTGKSIAWLVEIDQAGQPLYRLTVRLKPGDWDVIITDIATGAESKLRLARIYNKRLVTPFGSSVLPKLTQAFTWKAWSESDSGDGVTVYDWVPDAAANNSTGPDALQPFPQ